jgi:ubiquinone/menaquinone biosynthesis C-methylase UbiE
MCNHDKYRACGEVSQVQVLKCARCGLLMSEKRFSNFDETKLYENYYKNEITFGRFKFGIEYIIRAFRLFRAFKIHTIDKKARSILDVGSGTGYLLYYLRKHFGYTRTVGTQLAKNAYEYSKEVLGLDIYNQDLLELDLPVNSFDLVTIFHVLEHLKKPEDTLEKTYRLLKDRGKLVIEVPNHNSWSRRLAGDYWLGWDIEYHLNFYSKDTLVILLKSLNYKIKKVHTFSLEYSGFISTQSLISRLTKTDHYIFNWIQGARMNRIIYFHCLLFMFLFPWVIVINLLLIPTNKGEVLLVVAEKKI